MTALVIAEHDHASIKGATLNTVTAAAACGGDVHVLVAGHNAAGAAAAAAQIAGVAKVIHADSDALAHGLAHKGALIKVLARGEITRPVKVSAHGFSKAAAAAIEAAGGSVETLPLPYKVRPAAQGNQFTNR